MKYGAHRPSTELAGKGKLSRLVMTGEENHLARMYAQGPFPACAVRIPDELVKLLQNTAHPLTPEQIATYERVRAFLGAKPVELTADLVAAQAGQLEDGTVAAPADPPTHQPLLPPRPPAAPSAPGMPAPGDLFDPHDLGD